MLLFLFRKTGERNIYAGFYRLKECHGYEHTDRLCLYLQEKYNEKLSNSETYKEFLHFRVSQKTFHQKKTATGM